MLLFCTANCCVANYLNKSVLWNNNVYCLKVSVSQGSRYDLVHSVSQGASKGCNQSISRATVILRLDLGKTHFQVHLGDLAGFSSLLAAGQRLPLIPCQMLLRHMTWTDWESQDAGKGVLRRWKSQCLFFFLFVLFIRKSFSPKEKKLIKQH